MSPFRSSLSDTSRWAPTAASERYASLDILRGLALFGVLMINLLTLFRVPLLEHILRPDSDVVDFLAVRALEFKALTIFSFLFGVGTAIQAERAAARTNSPSRFLVRRFLWLLVFGCVHLVLIWNGDILALYAVCGLLLVPFLRLRAGVLALAGAAAIVFPEVVPLGLHIPSGQDANELIAQAREVYATGGYGAILAFRWHETRVLILPLLLAILPRTFGLMLLGVAAWHTAVLRKPEAHRRTLAIVLLVAAPLSLVPSFASPILLAAAYTAIVLMLGRMKWVAPLGRMALSNYLLQSIIFGFIFYGYGLGRFGRMDAPTAAALGIALYVAQVIASTLWLRHFRFGPFEWLWRSLSYGEWQPMLGSRPTR